MKVDLHIHSTASDGRWTPVQIVAEAATAGLDVIAISDHDTVAGLEEARAAARALSVEIVPALEVSTSWLGADLHILGYFVDPDHPAIVAHSARSAEHRETRMRDMVGRLRDEGLDLPFDRVMEEVAAGASIGRPHLARALVAAGIVESVPEAFDRYIGNDRPAYIPTRLLDSLAAMRMIREAGGISVWAHPPGHLLGDLLPTFKEGGLAGLEVYRPRASADRVLRFEQAALTMGLLVSGGSDWHGPEDGPFGEFQVPSAEVAALLEAGGL